MISQALLLTALATFGLVSAQSNTEIAAIEAHFEQASLSPDLIESFEPQAILDVAFGALTITPGQSLTVEEVQPTPELTLTPANDSVQFTGAYTVAMVDADIVGTDQSSITRHWLINGATVEDNTITNASATAITAYGAPFPAEGSGPHRYVILVYAQPEGFVAPESPAPGSPIEAFDFKAYVAGANLVGPVAANYIQVEQGSATMSIPATSPVVSSTLAAETSSSSGTATGTGTSGSAAPETTSETDGSNKQTFSLLSVSAVAFGIIYAMA